MEGNIKEGGRVEHENRENWRQFYLPLILRERGTEYLGKKIKIKKIGMGEKIKL